MAYGDRTNQYQIPIPEDGEPITNEDERAAATIIENQIRAGVLGAGGNRVYREGSYAVRVSTANVTTVVLMGNPAVQGLCNEGLVESFDAVVWENLNPATTYYLYIRASAETYRYPEVFDAVASTSLIVSDDHLLLAKINTTGATPSTPPTVDTNPAEKASAFNLFELINTSQDPFGPVLSQSALTILSQFTVYLGDDKTALFSQLNADATLPVISIENFSDQPELRSGQELRFADSRLVDGFALTDSANPAFLGAAVSIIGALNELLSTLLSHLNDSTDPHGETLNQTNLVISNYLQLPRLELRPPTGPPESPPGSPPPPGPPGPPVTLQEFEIHSDGRLKFGDSCGSITLTEEGQCEYAGEATSLIGALNELLALIVALTAEINDLNGQTLAAISPVVMEISPDEVGASLHFKIQISEDDTFSVIVVEKDSSDDPANWYYEKHISTTPSPPPAPPPPPRSPHSPLPFFEVPELTEPIWSALPSGGLAEAFQLRPDGLPVKVQYRVQVGDGLFLRRRYSVRAQQTNLEYGEYSLGTLVFG